MILEVLIQILPEQRCIILCLGEDPFAQNLVVDLQVDEFGRLLEVEVLASRLASIALGSLGFVILALAVELEHSEPRRERRYLLLICGVAEHDPLWRRGEGKGTIIDVSWAPRRVSTFS